MQNYIGTMKISFRLPDCENADEAHCKAAMLLDMALDALKESGVYAENTPPTIEVEQ